MCKSIEEFEVSDDTKISVLGRLKLVSDISVA